MTRRRTLPVLALLLTAAALPPPDPLATFYGNTLVGLAADNTDRFHLWLQPGGEYRLLGGSPPLSAGQFTAAQAGGGFTTVCLLLPRRPIVPPGFAPADVTPAPFATSPCLTLRAHDPGDRWSYPAAGPGAHLMLLRGQQ